jgi:hypothetical protein
MKTFEKWLKEQNISVKSATAANYVDYAVATKNVNKEELTEEQSLDLFNEYSDFMRQKQNELIESKASKDDLIAIQNHILDEQKRENENTRDLLRKQMQLNSEGSHPNASKTATVKPLFAKENLTAIREANVEKADIFITLTEKGFEKETQEVKDLETKATTTTASVVGNANALDLAGVGQLASRANNFYNFLNTIAVPANANGTIRYYDWDEATKVRAAAMVAEGAAFPESTASWQVYTEKLKKIGDLIPWTDEFEYDDQFLVNELGRFLTTNVNLIKGNQVINGDGTGNNIKGLITFLPAYTPVASGIVDASIYDLFVKLRESIEAQAGNKYRTNFAVMNIADINKYKLKKDANNNYIMPPFYDAAGNRIDGVTVIEDNAVVANTMFIGDSSYVSKYEQPGLGIEFGYINTDFRDGLKRARLYNRILLNIRTVDRPGFLKVTDIGAALTTLAT